VDNEPVSVLFSYWYFQNQTPFDKITAVLREATRRGRTVRVLVDSGAFSADTQGHRISGDEYADWIRDRVVPEWGPWVVGCLNLDVLRNPEASWKNWRRLADRGVDTIPVTHMGDGTDVIDRYVAAGSDYVALGAMVGKSITRKARWAAHIHKHVLSNHPEVRLHGLGLAGQELVERLPWYSVDSSSFGSGYRFARAVVYDRQSRKCVAVQLSGAPPDRSVLEMIRRDYGLGWDDIRDPGAHNRRVLVQFAARSLLAWQYDLRRFRPVTAPPSRSVTGPHVSFVDRDPDHTGWVLNGPHVSFVDNVPDHYLWTTTAGPHITHADNQPLDTANYLEAL
jgi:hypothetical protein